MSVPSVTQAATELAVSINQIISPDWTITSVQNQKLSLVRISFNMEQPGIYANWNSKAHGHDNQELESGT